MRSRAIKVTATACLIVYLLLLTKLIVFKYPTGMISDILSMWSLDNVARQVQTANFIPFKTISSSLFNPQLRIEVTTLIYNVAAFIPFGVFLPIINRNARKLIVVLVFGLMLSFAYELVQLVTLLGSADIDDLILNAVGTAVGYGSFKLIRLTVNSEKLSREATFLL